MQLPCSRIYRLGETYLRRSPMYYSARDSFGKNQSVVVFWDLNATVGNEVIVIIIGQHEVPGRNKSGERLLEICAELELVVGNSWFKKKDLHKYT